MQNALSSTLQQNVGVHTPRCGTSMSRNPGYCYAHRLYGRDPGVYRSACVPLASVARTIAQVTKDDAAIRDCIPSELAKQPWHAVSVDVVVHDGDVDLSGTILDERLREALKVLIENVAGVKKIHDHIVWVKPYSGMAFASPEDDAAKGRPAGMAVSGVLPL